VAFVGEQGHGGSHELLADAEQHHAHRVHQLLDAAAGLQADFVEAVITAVLQDLGHLPTVWCNGLQGVQLMSCLAVGCFDCCLC